MIDQYSNTNIQLPNELNDSLITAHIYQTDNNQNTITSISSSAEKINNGNYEISITVQNSVKNSNGTMTVQPSKSGVIAYARSNEVETTATVVDPGKVIAIANNIINLTNHTSPKIDNNVTYRCSN
jgi:hypothetical protein